VEIDLEEVEEVVVLTTAEVVVDEDEGEAITEVVHRLEIVTRIPHVTITETEIATVVMEVEEEEEVEVEVEVVVLEEVVTDRQ